MHVLGRQFHLFPVDEVKKDTVSDVIKYIKDFPEVNKLLLLSPIHLEEGRTIQNKLKALAQQGYATS